MTKRLQWLIEEARNARPTPEEKEAQRRSFAAGNVGLSNEAVTRELVDRAAEKMAKK